LFDFKSIFRAKNHDQLEENPIKNSEDLEDLEPDEEAIEREISLRAELVKNEDDDESYELSKKIVYYYHNNIPLIGISDHKVIEGLFLLAAIKKDKRFFKRMINEISVTVITEEIYQTITKMGLSLDDEKINEAFKKVNARVGLEQITIKEVAKEFTSLTIADAIKDLERADVRTNKKIKRISLTLVSKDEILIKTPNLLKTKPNLSEEDREILVEKLHTSKDTIATIDENGIGSIRINHVSNQKSEGNSAQDIKKAIVEGLREGFSLVAKENKNNSKVDEAFEQSIIKVDEDRNENDNNKAPISTKHIKNSNKKPPKKIIPKEKSIVSDEFLNSLTALEKKKIDEIEL